MRSFLSRPGGGLSCRRVSIAGPGMPRSRRARVTPGSDRPPQPGPPAAIALITVLLTAVVLIASQAMAQDASMTDVFGSPLPWGGTSQERRISLRTGTQRLIAGQPLELFIHSPNPGGDPPYVMLGLDGAEAPTRLVMRGETGSAVMFYMETFRVSSSIYHLRLHATGRHGRFGYFRPGRYHLRLHHDRLRDPRIPEAFFGRLQSNDLTIEVVEYREGMSPSQMLADAMRDGAASRSRSARHVEKLADPDPRKAREAERALWRELPGAVALLEQAAGGDDPEAAARARRLMRNLLATVAQQNREWPEPSEDGPLLGQLSESSWQLMREFADEVIYERLRIKAARYAPVALIDMREPTEEQVQRVLERLNHDDPCERIRAVRSVTPTRSEPILHALLERLNDPYMLWPARGVPGRPFPRYPVAEEVVPALRRLEPEAYLLVSIGRERDDLRERQQIIRLLGEAAPTERSIAFLAELAEDAEQGLEWAALTAMGELMPATTDHLVGVVRDDNQPTHRRRWALQSLGRAEAVQRITPVVLEMLRSEDESLMAAAAAAAGQLQIKEAAPDLKRIALNDTGALGWKEPGDLNQDTRNAAMAAAVAILPWDEAGEFLVSLSSEDMPSSVRGRAILRLGAIEYRPAVPIVLDALEGDDWFVRANADKAMKSFTGLSRGVGHDDRTGRAAAWRACWERYGDGIEPVNAPPR